MARKERVKAAAGERSDALTRDGEPDNQRVAATPPPTKIPAISEKTSGVDPLGVERADDDPQ